jgi:hypothetical protein
MSFAVECPECGSGLEVEEEHRGWTVRCPHCRHEFRPGQGTPAVPTPEADSDELPKPKRRRREAVDDDEYYDDHDWALGEVSGPATALKVIGWIGIVLSLLSFGIWVVLVAMVMAAPPPGQNNRGGDKERNDVLAQAAIYIPQSCVAFVVSIVMLIGAGKMSRLENYGWAQAAAVVGMIPCISPCCLLGLPFGIWALTVLNRPDIQRAFRRARRGSFDD